MGDGRTICQTRRLRGHVNHSERVANAEAEAGDRQRESDRVGALGRVEPYSEVINLGAGSTPDRLDTLLVGRGDPVRKGQVLGFLGGYGEQIAQRDMFERQLEETRRRLETETALNRARIEAAEIRERQVLEVSPQRIAAQQATIESLDARVANDEDQLNSQSKLFAEGSGTRRQTEDLRSQSLQDKASLAAARAQLAELTRQFEIDKIDASIQIEIARATLARMEAEMPVVSLEHQIKLAEERARRMTLFAPIDGRILNILVKPGEEVGTGPILAMGDTDRMRVVAEVYETDITRVRLGQRTTVSSRALAAPVTGRVARIGDMIFKNDVLNLDPAARTDARVVQVWIDLDDAASTARLTNLTVDVLIDTTELGTPVADANSIGPRQRR